MADQERFRRMTTKELRETFLIDNLFHPGGVSSVYVDLDRTIIGLAFPLDQPLNLGTYDELKATYFTERRELGVLNIGNPGSILVGEQRYELDKFSCLYIGRGNPTVSFESADPQNPAEFYLLSYPAHASYPTALVRKSELEAADLGAPESSNKRRIRKCIHAAGIKSCQIVMGFTELQVGSVWNTMPPHTHMRRSEVYLYFNIPEKERVVHLMGPGNETRHLVVANKEAVVSPGWSIHAGVGTASYTFCWGMGGENQAYNDMDPIAISELI